LYKTDIKLNLIDKFVRGIQGGFCTKRLFYSTLYSVHFITEMYQTGIHSKTEWSLTGKQHWGRVHINQAIYQFIAKQNEVLLVNNIEEGSISIKLFIRDQLAMVHHLFFLQIKIFIQVHVPPYIYMIYCFISCSGHGYIAEILLI
jgi:hypothetical protein